MPHMCTLYSSLQVCVVIVSSISYVTALGAVREKEKESEGSKQERQTSMTTLHTAPGLLELMGHVECVPQGTQQHGTLFSLVFAYRQPISCNCETPKHVVGPACKFVVGGVFEPVVFGATRNVEERVKNSGT